MPKFSEQRNKYFNSVTGAGSIVTTREAGGDKSVTIDSSEKEALFTRYPSDTFARAGGGNENNKPSTQWFNIFDIESATYIPHELAIKYPKAKGNELRLYFKRETGFYPTDQDEWFIFTRTGEEYPFIGFYSAERLENILSGEQNRIVFENNYTIDDEDDEYQKAAASPKAQQDQVTYEGKRHKRDASLAAKSIKNARHQCQYDTNHQSFISGSSGKPFVEVHHLVPISRSEDFEHSLDVPANLIVLCPNCHRAIHYGDKDIKTKLINKFYNERERSLKSSGININIEELLNYYAVEQD
jgi:5-methylcytosine-specific restriction protein A